MANVFELVGKLSLDGVDKFNADISGAADKGSQFSEKLKSGLKTVAKVGVAAATAVGTAAGVIAKKSIDAYADYEQLIGGTELLFGDAAGYIEDKSKTAFASVQMSANDYLQQVNGFAVGLKTALGGSEQAAAELADRIITAEADVVAATGNSQEAVQNAFNGIMKSNFTMLDNLQLGITPTKEGFQQVIDKVNEWNAANGEATKYQITNLADCQSALVDYIEMQGLAGYAAMEGAQTISGAVASTKAAWQNLLVGFADENADLTTLTKDLMTSGLNTAKQIAPRIKQIFKGIAEAMPEIFQAIKESIYEAFPEVEEFVENVKEKFEEAKEKFNEVSTFLQNTFRPAFESLGTAWESLKTLLQPLIDRIREYVSSGQAATDGTNFLKTAIEFLAGVLDAIAITINIVIQIIQGFVTAFQLCRDVAIEFGNTIKEAVTSACETAITWFENLKTNVTTIWNNILSKTQAVWESVKSAIHEKVDTIRSNIESKFTEMKDGAIAKYEEMKSGLEEKIELIKSSVETKFNEIKDKITGAFNTAKETVQGIIDDIKGFLDFEWKLPSIKVPHFTKTGEDQYGVPTFGVEWYAKGGVFSQPTIFNTRAGMMGVGEAGAEAVAPIDVLQGYVASAVASQNDGIARALDVLIDAVVSLGANLPDDLADAMEGTSIKVNNREFGRLVRAVN